MKSVTLSAPIRTAVDDHLSGLDADEKRSVFGTDVPVVGAFKSDELFALVIGTQAEIDGYNRRAIEAGSPLPGVRMARQKAGTFYVNVHGGPLWIEGGGKVSGGQTIVGLEPNADVGIKGMNMERGGARGYRVGWAFVAAYGDAIDDTSVLDNLKLYLQ